MTTKTNTLVTQFVRMWPREVFDCLSGKGGAKLAKSLAVLDNPGVYVLYRDGLPCYVGKTDKLRRRLYSHANSPNNKLYSVWNYFSAFAIADGIRRSEVEGVLIAAMPTANGAKPRSPR